MKTLMRVFAPLGVLRFTRMLLFIVTVVPVEALIALLPQFPPVLEPFKWIVL